MNPNRRPRDVIVCTLEAVPAAHKQNKQNKTKNSWGQSKSSPIQSSPIYPAGVIVAWGSVEYSYHCHTLHMIRGWSATTRLTENSGIWIVCAAR